MLGASAPAASVVIVVVLLAELVAFLHHLYGVAQIPTSAYSILLRVLCGTTALNIALLLLSNLIPALQSPGSTTFSTVLYLVSLPLFTLAELEFLKMLAPFLGVSIGAIFFVQMVCVLGSSAHIATHFIHPSGDREWLAAMRVFWLTWPAVLSLNELLLQGVLMYFVILRLKNVGRFFFATFSALCVASWAVLLSVVVYASQTNIFQGGFSSYVILALTDAFGLCTIPMMRMLRQALLDRQNKNPKSSLIKRLRSKVMLARGARSSGPGSPPADRARHKSDSQRNTNARLATGAKAVDMPPSAPCNTALPGNPSTDTSSVLPK